MIENEIRDLEAILASGAEEIYVDGERTRFDLDQVRRRLRELRRQTDPAIQPRMAQIDLSGF